MRVIDFPQRSPEWFTARLGIPTASSFAKLITPTGKPSTSANGYINELVAERVTGMRQEAKVSEAMQRGTDLEPEALSFFELVTGLAVDPASLCLHDDIDAGASPDGFIGEDGLLEIKCPSAHTHVEYLRDNKLPAKYIPQVQGQMWITNRTFCHFLSYHPEFKPLMVIVMRDEDYIEKLRIEVTAAVMNVEIITKEYKR